MARTKQTARRSNGGRPPNKQLFRTAARKSAVYFNHNNKNRKRTLHEIDEPYAQPSNKRMKLNSDDNDSSYSCPDYSDEDSDSHSESENESIASIGICYCNDDPIRPDSSLSNPKSMYWRCTRCHSSNNYNQKKGNDVFMVMLKTRTGDGWGSETTDVKVLDVWNNRNNANQSALQVFQKESDAENYRFKKSYKNDLFNENYQYEHNGAHYHWVHVWVETRIVR
eukprot:478127_1